MTISGTTQYLQPWLLLTVSPCTVKYMHFFKAFFFLAKEEAEEGINEPGVKILAGRK